MLVATVRGSCGRRARRVPSIVVNRFIVLKGEAVTESLDDQRPTLVVRGLVKHVGPVIALARAGLEVRSIHALVGENG